MERQKKMSSRQMRAWPVSLYINVIKAAVFVNIEVEANFSLFEFYAKNSFTFYF